jgi:hypothetical protein
VKHDNSAENLEARGSRAEHLREHSRTRGRLSDGSFAPPGAGTPKVGTAPCSVAGCARPSRRRGLCSSHWFWSRNNGWRVPTHLIGEGRHPPRPGRRRKDP